MGAPVSLVVIAAATLASSEAAESIRKSPSRLASLASTVTHPRDPVGGHALPAVAQQSQQTPPRLIAIAAAVAALQDPATQSTTPPAGPPTSGPVGPIFSDPARIGQPPLPPSPTPAPAPPPVTMPQDAIPAAPRPEVTAEPCLVRCRRRLRRRPPMRFLSRRSIPFGSILPPTRS